MGHPKDGSFPVEGQGENFKQFVEELYDSEINDELDHNKIFSKETFVLSEKDLAIVNHSVQQILNEELELDDNDDDDDDEDDEDEDHSINNSDIDNKSYDSKCEQRFYNDEPSFDNNEIEKTVDSDAEYDDTHFLYDPPNKYKDRFLFYTLKVSPVLLLLVGIYLYFSNYSKTEITSIFGTSTPSPYMNHKIFVLEEEINSLKKLKNLDVKVDAMKGEIGIMKNYIENLQFNPDLESNGKQIADMMNQLEASIKQLAGKVEALEKPHTTKTVTLSVETHKPMKPLKTETNKLVNRYYNIANQCQVIRKLTSIPWRVRRRKSVKERIVYGLSDFVRRVWNNQQKPNSVKTLGSVNLLSANNHPKNALLDSPNKFWQIQASNVPIYYSVNIAEPISLYEVGIYHSRHIPALSRTNDSINADAKKRWFKCAPQNVEVLVRPVNDDVHGMKLAMGKYYNQDLKFDAKMAAQNGKELENWVRLGTMKYDINVNKGYQLFQWTKDVRAEIARYRVEGVMIVVHSNWGDEIVVLDTIRIFENSKEAEDRTNAYWDQYGKVEGGDDDVAYLGEEVV